MKIWTLASDDEGGTTSSVHMTERAAYLALIQENLPEEAREEALKELDLDGQEGHDFWEWFNDNKKDSLDTYNIDSHEIDVPAQPKLRVVVRVEGGTAEFLENPDGVDTVLIDYDEIGRHEGAALESAISAFPADLQPAIREYFIGEEDSFDDSLTPEQQEEWCAAHGGTPKEGTPDVLTCEDYDPDTEPEQTGPIEKHCGTCKWDGGYDPCITCNAETWPGWEPRAEQQYRNFYRCTHEGTKDKGKPATEWHDDWSCTSNDKCPLCNLEIEPFFSEELTVPKEVTIAPKEVAVLTDKLGATI